MANLDPEQLALLSPAGFAWYASKGKWVCPPHLALINEKLMGVAAGRIKRLIVTLPPRHGKSELISKYFPAWYLGLNPDKRVILTSYEASFASSWGRKARDILLENERIFGIKLNRESSAVQSWEILKHGGGMSTAGAGSPITGKGANCFVGGTRVITNYGHRDIDSLGQLLYNEKALSFNTRTGKYEYKPIKAWRRKKAGHFTRITTLSGRRIICTPEHRIFSIQRGYTEASDLNIGEEVVGIGRFEKVPYVRTKDAEEPEDMSQVLHFFKKCERRIKMLFLREEIQEAGIPAQEGIKAWDGGLLLLKKMFSKSPRSKKQKALSYLWGADPKKNNKVLLGRVQGSIKKNKRDNGLCNLWKRLLCEIKPHGLLLKGMCQSSTLQENDGDGKFALQGRQKLLSSVQNVAPRHCGKGRGQMPDMWQRNGGSPKWQGGSEKCISCAPHKRVHIGQFTGESNNYLPRMSYDASQVCTDTISTVETYSGKEQFVYDIEVEGNHNFFANEILAHNCFIVDDPLKNAEEAMSETIREKHKEWYRSTAYTRLEPGGAMVIIITRWHDDDLVGWLLDEQKNGGDAWEVINLPAIALEGDLIGRQPGEALWPDRFPINELGRIKQAVGTFWFESMYQQNPVPSEGGIIKRSWWKYYGEPPDKKAFKRYIWAWDTAVKVGQGNDYSVGIYLGETANGYYVLDLVRDRMEYPDLKRAIVSKFHGSRASAVVIEDKSSGQQVIQELTRGERLPIIACEPIADKVTRAHLVTPLVEAGLVYVPERAPWVGAFLDECLKFPAGTHDDQVDALVYGLDYLKNHRVHGVNSIMTGLGRESAKF